MSKVSHYLQEHLSGEVTISPDVRNYFSTDSSIFEINPSVVVYPINENDVRKIARFSWQLAERGRVVPITARGSGTDQTGGALGNGIMVVFPAHMNKIIELDSKTGSVVVEPGTNYGKLQQTLHTHGRFLPPFPSSMEYCTIGGAVANNASGEKTIKYGSTRQYVKSLRLVLSNGEVITTKRLSKRELKKKLGQATFEGEIYRNLDTLIEENESIIKEMALDVSKNSAGYALDQVKRKDGSFDLTPLIVGSQGTLGLVTETSLDTRPYNEEKTLAVANFSSIQAAQEAIFNLLKLPSSPSAIEIVDYNLLNFVHRKNPNRLNGIIEPPFANVVMLVEFDDLSNRTQKRMAKKAAKIFKKHAVDFHIETDEHQQEELWQIRHCAATICSHNEGNKRALPIVEDGVVPIENLNTYLDQVYKLFKKHGLDVALWGHGGNANIHMQPFLDLAQIGDRQKIFKIMDEYYNMVIDLDGSTSGEHGDGRLRAPYLQQLYGAEVYNLFRKVKEIFDPYGILNTGVKMDVTLNDIKPLLRHEYTVGRFYDHLPRT